MELMPRSAALLSVLRTLKNSLSEDSESSGEFVEGNIK
jgi:hypothetical protein